MFEIILWVVNLIVRQSYEHFYLELLFLNWTVRF